MQIIGPNSNLQLRTVTDLSVQVDAGLRRANITVRERQLFVRRSIVGMDHTIQRRRLSLPLSKAGLNRGVAMRYQIVQRLGPVAFASASTRPLKCACRIDALCVAA